MFAQLSLPPPTSLNAIIPGRGKMWYFQEMGGQSRVQRGEKGKPPGGALRQPEKRKSVQWEEISIALTYDML